MKEKKSVLGIVGGLGTLSGGDLFFKLLKSKAVLKNQQLYHFLFEQHPYPQINSILEGDSDITSRKFYAYNVCKGFEEKQVDKILLPCFASHTFIDQLQGELKLPIVDLMDALRHYLQARVEPGTKIGVLASTFVRSSGLFGVSLKDFEICYPPSQGQIMDIVYGDQGIKRGYLDGVVIEKLHQVCLELQQQGCTIILPGMTELSLVADQLWRRGIQLVDVNQVYAEYAVDLQEERDLKPFKLAYWVGSGRLQQLIL